MNIRKPRRDMTRPQAPVNGYECGWVGRWNVLAARRKRQADAIARRSLLNGLFDRFFRAPRVAQDKTSGGAT